MLYRFKIELSDVDNAVYETLDFRASQHPSETGPYLLSRVLAYSLSYNENLKFSSSGLSDPDTPALTALGKNSAIDIWIEIGNPSARKLHKAGKSAKQVIVYTYKSPEILIQDILNNDVYRADDLKIYALDSDFLLKLETHLQKNNKWSLLHQNGQLDISFEDLLFTTQVRTFEKIYSKSR